MTTPNHPSLLHWKSPRHARLFFALGILAMFLHILAGMGFMGSHAGKTGDNISVFSPQICTVSGLSPAPTGASVGHTAPADTGSMHNCCTLCVASSPLLLTTLPLAVSPAPTFSAHLPHPPTVRRAFLARTAHPPRGPPALA